MKKSKIITSCLMIMIILSVMPFFNFVKADAPNNSGSETKTFWESAGDWFNDVQEEGEGNVSEKAIEIVNQFMDIVNYVGTTLIIIATMFLGVKYMFGSVEGKSEVKESLMTLLVACVFFFGWQYIRDIILIGTGGTQLFLVSNADHSYRNLFGRLLGVVMMIVKVAAIVGVIYVGVRYIFSGATGKAELKGKSAYFVIGIILTFSSVTVLDVFAKALQDLLA
ncbi:MAG: hypothetical protein ACLTON_03465 [Christensenellales bacterium]